MAADGFLVSAPAGSDAAAATHMSTFTRSPVSFLKMFFTKTRRDCQSIDKTHLGRVLDGALLREDEFKRD